MPAADRSYGKPTPRAGPKHKPVLQTGKIIARTQQRFERSNPRARVAPKLRTPGVSAPSRAPTVGEVKRARTQELQYHSQAGAVRRAAKTQAKVGPGQSIRPPKGGRQVLTDKRLEVLSRRVNALAQEKGYKSLGESVAKQAAKGAVEREAKRKVKIGGFEVDAARLSKDPKVQLAGGLKKSGVGEAIAKLPFAAAKNAPKDIAELAVTTPTSLAHLGAQGLKLSSKAATGDYPGAFKQGKEIAKEQIAPYKEAIKHPVKFATERPVTSYLMFAPGVKVPLRGAARGARLVGKSTIKRPAATLPGTALKESRTAARQPGGLDAAKKLRGKTGPHVTAKELQRRVDEEHDLARHHEERRVAQAIKATKEQHKDSPKDVRKQAVAEATEQARDAARVESQQRFGRTFGANVEPQVTVGHIAEAEAKRQAAKQHKRRTKGTIKVAREHVERAKETARTAVEDAPTLRALETERETHRRELARDQQRHGSARVGLAEAKGRAAASRGKEKTSPELETLREQRKTAEAVPPPEPHWGVEIARKRVSTADRRVNTIERQLQRADERASHLEGVTVGRARSGGMSAYAGKLAADQAERVGHLTDALHEARTESAAARAHLKDVERVHRGRVRAHHGEVRTNTKAIDTQIRAEERRLRGVVPDEQQSRLLSAIEHRNAAAGHTQSRRAAIRDLDEQIAEERRVVREQARGHVAEMRGEHARAVEQHGTAIQVHRRLRSAAIDTARAHRETPLVNPEGKGRLFENPLDAKRVAYRLNQQAHQISKGGTPFQLNVREPSANAHTLRPDRPVTASRGHGETPLLFKVRKVGEDQYAVVPKMAAQRLYGGGGKSSQLSHASVGTGKATGAKLMRTSRGFFTQATLPLSLKWLGGQGVEAGIRSLVAGAGPSSRALYKRVVERMNELEPGAGDEFAMRVRGGQFGSTSAIAEQMGGAKTLAEDYAGTPLKTPAAMATLAGDLPGVRHTRAGWRRYSHGMTNGINGLIENVTREAMAGKALKQGPLLEKRVAGFEWMRERMGKVNRAVEDAAEGLLDTHSQVEAVREVDDMYGRYSRWSPEMRSLLLHWTPFLPWYLNAGRFLLKTLPDKHPMKAGLLANMNAADQEWREKQGLSLYGNKHVPDFLQGSYPKGADRYLRVGHYTPWGVGSDIGGSVAGLALPQVLGPIKNLAGVDWKWQPETKPGAKGQPKKPFNLGDKALRALVTVLEEQVPGVSQAGRISGLTARHVDKRKVDTTVRERLLKELPTTPTASNKPKPKKAPKASSPWGGGGFGGSSGWGSGGGW